LETPWVRAPASASVRVSASVRASVSGMLADVLGDDVDGIASELADFEFMGWLS